MRARRSSGGRLSFAMCVTCAAAVACVGCKPNPPVTAGKASQAVAQPICPGSRVPVVTATGGSAPFVELELAGQKGLFLIDYGASQSVIEAGIWQLPPKPGASWSTLTTAAGDTIDLIAMGPHTMPGWTNVQTLNFQVEDRNISVAGQGDQIGVLGAGDLLFNQAVEFHYEDAANQHVIISGFGADCPIEDLNAAGLLRIGQQGHWQQGTDAANGIHNGPVAYLSFASAGPAATPLGVRTFAQVDTGLDDSVWPRTIIINGPLLERLRATSTPPVLRDTAEILDCKGRRQRQDVYALPGQVARIEDENEGLIRRVDQYHLIFQSAAPGCHGISAHSAPAAQLGASFLREFGTTIFLGQRNEVWIRSDRPVAP